MKTGKLNAAQQWQNVDSLLRRWLIERQQLLSLFCSLSSAAKQTPPSASAQPKIDRFCELLVDYVSAGHFEVYCELLDEGARRGASGSREAGSLYQQIVPTTLVALDFNDRYLRRAGNTNFAADLSGLGQVLASRFDWEDALIRLLHLGSRAVA
jgi:regulator of sigma D